MNEEIQHLFVDAKNLPPSLRVKMPEYLNLIDNFRQCVISRGFVSEKIYEKRETKDATVMLSSFLYNVLKDNRTIIEHYQMLLETAMDEN